MQVIILTQDTGAFLGPIARLLGILMDAIFRFIDMLGLPNTGMAIILFTIVIYIFMLPLTIRQQKFSKLSAVMNPELQVIRDKYKGKKDQASMQAMNTETKAVYERYGVSQAGNCVQLVIQMPILFALYRVISNMPAYVSKIKEAFYPLVNNLLAIDGSREFLSGNEIFQNAARFIRGNNLQSDEFLYGPVESDFVQNTVVDVLNRAATPGFVEVVEQYPELAQDVGVTESLLNLYNNFLGINIAESPSFMVTEAWNGGVNIAWLALLGAFVIPLLSAATQWINVKLMPQNAAAAGGDQQGQMASTMKTMNTMMPLMSAFFCFTLPAGMGLYWVAGAVVRSIQQVVINRHFDKMDLDELIKQSAEKRAKKLEKKGIDPNKVSANANLNTRKPGALATLAEKANQANAKALADREAITAAKNTGGAKNPGGVGTKAANADNTNTATGAEATSGTGEKKVSSIAEKANMVKAYNERNKK